MNKIITNLLATLGLTTITYSHAFRLSVLVALSLAANISAKENQTVTAQLKQKFQNVSYINNNGLEYYELSRNNPDDYGYLYGIADIKGRVLISYSHNYSYISPIQLQNGQLQEFRSDIYYWALQTTDNKFGVADKNGKIIIPCTHCGGIYLIEYNTLKRGVIDFNYEQDGWAFLMNGDRTSALFNEKGEVLIPLSRGYTDISLWVNDIGGTKYIEVRKDGKVGLCDERGKELLPPVYSSLQLKDSCITVLDNGMMYQYNPAMLKAGEHKSKR